MHHSRKIWLGACLLVLGSAAHAADPLSWEAVRDRFRAQNPALARQNKSR